MQIILFWNSQETFSRTYLVLSKTFPEYLLKLTGDYSWIIWLPLILLLFCFFLLKINKKVSQNTQGAFLELTWKSSWNFPGTWYFLEDKYHFSFILNSRNVYDPIGNFSRTFSKLAKCFPEFTGYIQLRKATSKVGETRDICKKGQL